MRRVVQARSVSAEDFATAISASKRRRADWMRSCSALWAWRRAERASRLARAEGTGVNVRKLDGLCKRDSRYSFGIRCKRQAG